jgi:membrane protease YdiL (CAAX protease family)
MRAFALFVGLFILAGIIAACVAYPAYELTSTFAGWAFHRVAGRIAMLVLALELTWFCRHLGIRTRRDFGYGLPWRRFVGQSLLWALAGVATAALGAAFLMATGLRVIGPDVVMSAGSLARLALIGLSSGIAVALIEETVMRGAMHTAIERESGPWAAALLTAPLFAVLHFFAKVRIPPAELAWHSGFDLLARSFAPLADLSLVLDSFLSWLAVGLVLSYTRVLTGNIAIAIGLHAGWVVVLRMLQEGTVRGTTPAYAAWVGRFDGVLGYWLLPWAAGIGLVLWLTRSAWAPPARTSCGPRSATGMSPGETTPTFIRRHE